MNFSTAPATSPTSSLRPRPGSTTENSPSASLSIATVSARMGRAMLKTEKMHAPIRTSATSMPVMNEVCATDAASASASARALRLFCFAKSVIWLASSEISSLIGASVCLRM